MSFAERLRAASTRQKEIDRKRVLEGNRSQYESERLRSRNESVISRFLDGKLLDLNREANTFLMPYAREVEQFLRGQNFKPEIITCGSFEINNGIYNRHYVSSYSLEKKSKVYSEIHLDSNLSSEEINPEEYYTIVGQRATLGLTWGEKVLKEGKLFVGEGGHRLNIIKIEDEVIVSSEKKFCPWFIGQLDNKDKRIDVNNVNEIGAEIIGLITRGATYWSEYSSNDREYGR